MNAVQNALLYSPKETEPILTVCYRESRGRKFVEIRVVNESSMFSSKDFSGSVDVNFSYQRMGYGIPIIKRFAQVSGGWFDMTEENGRVTVTISLPAAHYGSGAELPLRKPSAAQYDTGIPDFTEIMCSSSARAPKARSKFTADIQCIFTALSYFLCIIKLVYKAASENGACF